MSDNDDAAGADGDDGAGEATPESLESRLEDAEAAVEAAGTEADLDDVVADLDAVAADLESADLPVPDDEDETGPKEELEGRLGDVRDALEAARGPYAEDVASEVAVVREAVAGDEWTEQGVDELHAAVETFAAAVEEHLDVAVAVPAPDADFAESPAVDGGTLDGLAGALQDAEAAVTEAGLDADEDAETIEALLAAAGTLADDVDAAEAWTDLTVRDMLTAHGFYEVLDHYKDFPPEWSALKAWEAEGRADMILLALDLMDSEFMERHCFEALTRLGPAEALDPMLELADRRDQNAIRVLGKIADDDAVDQLLEYADAGDRQLRMVTLQALGEIGDERATQAVADQLAAESATVRSKAARSLGLLGDTRAVEPLADVLDDDESDDVRAAAAWALNQIGTEDARAVVADYRDDRAYVVQAEAEKAA